MIQDHYRTLDLSITARKRDVSIAYRKLAPKYHPDRNAGADSRKKFISITEAYFILYNDGSRKIYDKEYPFLVSPVDYTTDCFLYDPEAGQDYGERSNPTHQVNILYQDETLNKWSRKARKQGEKFAEMTFENFTRILMGNINKTSLQLKSFILIAFGALFTLVSCTHILYGLFARDNLQHILFGLIVLPIGFLLRKAAERN